MKFEFDNRTGTMVPKKDEQIYFAKSQGGGLRIDDNKNHRRYIIERDGGLTVLQGPRLHAEQFLHIYDSRDAHIIADRVIRMFGRSHFYSNYRKFLRGIRESHIIGFEEFINE